MSGSRGSVELGPVEWAVVTRHLVPSGLFVRLEESGEEAFVDIVSVYNHPLCRNPEYWPDAGERIRVRAVGRRPSVLNTVLYVDNSSYYPSSDQALF